MLAMIKKFEQLDTFAGHYVEIADTIDTFLMSISNTLGTFDIKKDDWSKRAKTLLRKTYGNHISEPYLKPRLNPWKHTWPFSVLLLGGEKLFSATQRQHIQRAMRKAGISNLNAIMLDNQEAIITYVIQGETNGSSKYQQLPHTFGVSEKETIAQGQERLRRAERIQAGRNNSKILLAEGLTSIITLAKFKDFINSISTQPLPHTKKTAIARRATDVILQTLFLMSARKGRRRRYLLYRWQRRV